MEKLSAGTAANQRGVVEDRDAATLRHMHELHAADLWRYVYSLTRDTYQAEDIVQETLLRAWNSPDLLRERAEAVRGWLFTVARNLVIDQARSARSRHEKSSDLLPENPAGDHAERVFDEILIRDAWPRSARRTGRLWCWPTMGRAAPTTSPRNWTSRKGRSSPACIMGCGP